MRVLDVGCGVGGPAREIAQFSDANIVGLNNNDFQVHRARKYTQKAGLENQVTFVKGDFMHLAEQFGENSFDAVYAIEATCHAPTWEGVYGEIMKVLKPGGVVSAVICHVRPSTHIPHPQFGLYEWCMTDTWDPAIPEHKELQHQIELGNGIPEMRAISKSREALLSVGFEIEHEEDLADRPDEIRWYYPLEGDLSKAQTVWDLFTVWRISWSGQLVTHSALWVMEMLRLLPKGTVDVGEALKVAATSLVKGGQTKVHAANVVVVVGFWTEDFSTAVHADVPGYLPETSPKLKKVLRVTRNDIYTLYYSCIDRYITRSNTIRPPFVIENFSSHT